MGKNEKKKTGDKPAFKIRVGNVTATVWKNVNKNKEGEPFTAYNTDIIRSYLDKDENWQTTSSFGLADLPKVIAAAQEAYKFIAVKTEEADEEE